VLRKLGVRSRRQVGADASAPPRAPAPTFRSIELLTVWPATRGAGATVKPPLSDELWAVVEPLLPSTRSSGTRGHPPVPNRVALAGIIFVLKTGTPWESVPRELGCSGMTLWRRLRAWHQAGVWERLHPTLLQHLADAGTIDWSRASADAARVPAIGKAPRPGRSRPIAASRAASTP
jgi:transposase